MQSLTRVTDTGYWVDQMFAARATRCSGVLRRCNAWVDRDIGRECFISAMRMRGFHLIRSADQFTVMCRNEPVEMIF